MKTTSPYSVSNPFEKYKKQTVFHARFIESIDRMSALIEGPLTQNLILLIGPTGVGKSWLIHELSRRYKLMGSPLIRFECFPPLQSTSPFRRFFEDYQKALNDPFATKPRALDGSTALEGEIFSPRTTLDNLSRVVCDRVRKLKPRAVLLDEANVFADLSAAQTRFSLKLFKAVANQTEVPHVLVGTEALLNFIGLDSQLQRRGRVIHLDTYSNDTEADKTDFVNALDELLNLSPIPANQNIIHKTLNVRDLCYGAIGILADLILNGCKLAHQRNSSELTFADLKAVAVQNKGNVITDEQQAIREYINEDTKSPARTTISCAVPETPRVRKRSRVQRETPRQYKTSNTNGRPN